MTTHHCIVSRITVTCNIRNKAHDFGGLSRNSNLSLLLLGLLRAGGDKISLLASILVTPEMPQALDKLLLLQQADISKG